MLRMMEAGIYPEIPVADYAADPAPEASLTQSIAKILLARSALHAWQAHPRLNPDFVARDDTKFDIGNMAHRLLLGRGRGLVVLDEFDDWRKKEAREKREAAALAGQLAVLGPHYALASRMAQAAREQLELRGEANLFAEPQLCEVMLLWQPDPDIWCRQLVDFLSADRHTFADYKTTREGAAPHALARKMVNDGWPIQAAFAERGLDILHPATTGRRRYLFIVQEAEPPYALNIADMSESALTMGRKMVDAALGRWREALAARRWRGYPLKTVTPEFPGWAEAEWLDREQVEFGDLTPMDAG